MGIEGTVTTTLVAVPAGADFNLVAPDLKEEVRTLLSAASVEHRFEYVKVSGDTFTTRPTSRTHYVVQGLDGSLKDGSLKIERNAPNLQFRMIDLHKGHGPGIFKHFQKIMALGVLVIILNRPHHGPDYGPSADDDIDHCGRRAGGVLVAGAAGVEARSLTVGRRGGLKGRRTPGESSCRPSSLASADWRPIPASSH